MTDRAEARMQAFADRSMTEQVVYRPTAGEAREITAIVDRGGRDDYMHAAAPSIEVTVINDATEGITPAEINSGGDLLDVAEHLGDTPASRTVQRIVAEDAEFVTVEVK